METIIKEGKELSAKNIAVLKRIREMLDSLISQAEGKNEVAKVSTWDSGIEIHEELIIEEE
jgi:hypothetical protein